MPEVIVVVGCYLDDSHAARRSAIAGYFGPLYEWDTAFIPAWRDALATAPHRICEYKTSNCRQLTGEFEGWTRLEANDFALRCLTVLGDRTRMPNLYGVGAGMVLPPTLTEEARVSWEHEALVWCFSMILASVLSFLDQWVPKVTAVQFVCDEQPGLQGKFRNAFGEARSGWAGASSLHVSHLLFADSKVVLPLQAADILAYETRKDIVSRFEIPQRPQSRALRYLIARRPHVGLVVDHYAFESPNERDALPLMLYGSSDVSSMWPWVAKARTLHPPALAPNDEGAESPASAP